MESIRSDSARNNLRKTSGPPEPAPLCKYLFFQNHNDACMMYLPNWQCENLVKPKFVFWNIYEKHDFCNTNLLSHFRILQSLCSEKLYILYDFLAWLDYMNCTKVIVHLGSVKMDMKFLKYLRFLVMLLVGSPFFW